MILAGTSVLTWIRGTLVPITVNNPELLGPLRALEDLPGLLKGALFLIALSLQRAGPKLLQE